MLYMSYTSEDPFLKLPCDKLFYTFKSSVQSSFVDCCTTYIHCWVTQDHRFYIVLMYNWGSDGCGLILWWVWPDVVTVLLRIRCAGADNYWSGQDRSFLLWGTRSPLPLSQGRRQHCDPQWVYSDLMTSQKTAMVSSSITRSFPPLSSR